MQTSVSRTGIFLRYFPSFSNTVFDRFLADSIPELSRSRSSGARSPPPPPPAESRSSRKMPKKDKTKGPPATAAPTEAPGPVSRDRTGAVTIAVHAKPGSKHSGITDVSVEAVGVSIAAPPTDGEANTELIRYLAEVLELKKSHLSLDKGSRSRDKLIRVDSSLSPEEVLSRLQKAAS